MKKLLISLASTLSPVFVALAAAPAHGYLWECPYSNFLLTEDGRCIDLTYMVSDGEREKPVGKTGRHPFPEWLLSTDPRFDAQKDANTTESNDQYTIYQDRYASILIAYPLDDEVQITTIDCDTGWGLIYKEPIGAFGEGSSIRFLDPAEESVTIASRVFCSTYGLTPVF